MAPTTTVRVDTETHRRLVALSEASGTSLVETVRAAADSLERQRFIDECRRSMAELRSKPGEWADYLAEAESTHVTDGID